MKKFLLVIVLITNYVLGQIGYTQTGLASYYADKFHGRRTASGEIYDKNKLTAAHRELPFGTLVKVTNLRNNKSVIVKINDRGPWKSTRIIDLSYAAAKKLDMIAAGEVPVRIEVVKPAPEYEQHTNKLKKKKSNTNSNYNKPFYGYGTFTKTGKKVNLKGYYGIQLASFSSLQNAKAFADKVNKKGYSRVFIKVVRYKGKKLYKVILGKYASREIAKKNIQEIKHKGLDGFPVKY